jgi:hypothetical protein
MKDKSISYSFLGVSLLIIFLIYEGVNNFGLVPFYIKASGPVCFFVSILLTFLFARFLDRKIKIKTSIFLSKFKYKFLKYFFPIPVFGIIFWILLFLNHQILLFSTDLSNDVLWPCSAVNLNKEDLRIAKEFYRLRPIDSFECNVISEDSKN